MDEFSKAILIALVPSLMVSIVTAIVTVRLSIRQFYSQRWWEKKAEAYSSIIEQLSYLQHYYECWWEDVAGERRLTNEYKEQLEEDYRQARESVERAAAVGAYIVSDETADALGKLVRELNRSDLTDRIEEISQHYCSVRECIARIRRYAKGDLNRE